VKSRRPRPVAEACCYDNKNTNVSVLIVIIIR